MGEEIERKFRVVNTAWREAAKHGRNMDIDQGYLCANETRSVRVRVCEGQGGEDRAQITVKGPTEGVTRLEFEYEVPVEDARQMMKLAGDRRVTKRRHMVTVGEREWVIDEFFGANAGLVVAELELEDEDAGFERPDWLGEEISDRPEFYNSNLAVRPFTGWETS